MSRTLAAAIVLVVLVAAVLAAVGCAKKTTPIEEPPASMKVPAGVGNAAVPADVTANTEPAENAPENTEAAPAKTEKGAK